MPATLIVQLLAAFGPAAVQLIDQLITLWSTNATVTPEQWAALSASLKLSAADHMKAQLTAAGIALDDPHAVALLKLVS
ncbi:MAG: hypothetical protein KGL39_59435 [Patescibacteria group bacterium]|nr:hypothetical protein [Patescibacteria group bacterium]